MLKWPVVAEAWLYRDPQEFADALISRSVRETASASAGQSSSVIGAASHVSRDRYYTQARRVHVKQLMRGRR